MQMLINWWQLAMEALKLYEKLLRGQKRLAE